MTMFVLLQHVMAMAWFGSRGGIRKKEPPDEQPSKDCDQQTIRGCHPSEGTVALRTDTPGSVDAESLYFDPNTEDSEPLASKSMSSAERGGGDGGGREATPELRSGVHLLSALVPYV